MLTLQEEVDTHGQYIPHITTCSVKRWPEHRKGVGRPIADLPTATPRRRPTAPVSKRWICPRIARLGAATRRRKEVFKNGRLWEPRSGKVDSNARLYDKVHHRLTTVREEESTNEEKISEESDENENSTADVEIGCIFMFLFVLDFAIFKDCGTRAVCQRERVLNWQWLKPLSLPTERAGAQRGGLAGRKPGG